MCEQRIPLRGCAFAQALLSCLCSHINRQVCLINWHVFQIVFWDFMPEEEVISCLKKKPILARYQSIFYTKLSEKNTEGLLNVYESINLSDF